MDNGLRALVVEDDAVAREATVLSLEDEGFSCVSAANGLEAMAALERYGFDVVITDLRMPKRHGHSLAVELTALGSDRPLVVVLTGVLEPRLLKDLIARDVDDVEFKPVDLEFFSAKVRAMCERRARLKRNARSDKNNANQSSAAGEKARDPRRKIRLVEIEERLATLQQMPTLSGAAFEVFKLTMDAHTSSGQLAAAIQLEPALIAHVLRLANSSCFNPSPSRIGTVEEAVVRLGQRHVGEVALSLASYSVMAKTDTSLFALDRVWRKCLASAICLELMLKQSSGGGSACGSFCSAVLLPLGRLLLASAYPETYTRLIRQCELTGSALTTLEAETFEPTIREVASRLLDSWGLPEAIHLPLSYTSLPFSDIDAVPPSDRRRVQTIKVAEFLGQLVVSEWEPWELVDVPSAELLQRLGITNLDRMIEQCRRDLAQITSFNSVGTSAGSRKSKGQSFPKSVPYFRISRDGVDLIPYLSVLTDLNLKVMEIAPSEGTVVVNAIGAAFPRLMNWLRQNPGCDALILTDLESAEKVRPYSAVLSFPCSHKQFWDAVRGTTHSDH